MTKQASFTAVCLLSLSTALAFGQAVSPTDNHVAAQLEAHHEPLRSGSEVSFKMKLDTPLPEGAYFQVRLSPVLVDQELTVASGEPTNRERTEFLLHAKLPDKAVPGEWRIKIVYLFLAGTGWTSNTLATNDLRFTVEGPKLEIPTKATATLVASNK
ncbi:hypothetical protein [Granulicella aggregans]|uniref:hypothetical protein n=1 Tax=Granulicella aggregans TaxID=474949 RepID=UPI0021DFBCD3|nr:hypothetical protein [Granulicella aggregans]